MPAPLLSLLSGCGEEFPKRGSKTRSQILDWQWGTGNWALLRVLPISHSLFLMQLPEDIGASHNPDQLPLLQNWQTPNVVSHHQRLNLWHRGLGRNSLDILGHVALNRCVTKTVMQC